MCMFVYLFITFFFVKLAKVWFCFANNHKVFAFVFLFRWQNHLVN
jgi:hypothetical protein